MNKDIYFFQKSIDFRIKDNVFSFLNRDLKNISRIISYELIDYLKKQNAFNYFLKYFF